MTVAFNGVDLAKYLVDEADAMIDHLVQTIDVDQTDKRTALDTLTPEQRFSFDLTMGLWLGTVRIVRVRPAAPVRACLWRRNLDGGAWRKRGHVAHRGR